jgi:hypothetical protein
MSLIERAIVIALFAVVISLAIACNVSSISGSHQLAVKAAGRA